MANPQLKNGFTEIANEILEELCKINLSGHEFRVCLFILRKTYGFKKKEDWISLSQFSKGTGLKKQRVCEALRSLETRCIITRKRNDKSQKIGFIKNYNKWKTLRKSVTLRKNVISVTLKRNLPLRESVHTKETITKETITKEIPENFLTIISSIIDSYFQTLTERQRVRLERYRRDYYSVCYRLLNHPDKSQRYTVEEIKKAVLFARADSFWSGKGGFLSFSQLIEENKKGIKYIEVFLNQADNKKIPPGNPIGEVRYESDI